MATAVRKVFKGKRKVRNRAGNLIAEGGRIFLPDHLDQVRAIAMRGISEKEMCEFFDIHPKQINLWKRQYPAFKEAIEQGYTDADTAVLSALYQRAIGYQHDEEKVFQWDGAIITHDTVKHYPPDVAAIKLWLTNRQGKHWADKKETEHTGKPDGVPIGLRDETKLEVMSSILALIKPKDDTPVTIDGRTGEVEDA